MREKSWESSYYYLCRKYPQPSAMKFEIKITDHTLSFENTNSAKDAPLVKELLIFLLLRRFLLRKIIFPFPHHTVQWEEVVMEIRRFIKAYRKRENNFGSFLFSNRPKVNTSNPEYFNIVWTEIVKIWKSMSNLLWPQTGETSFLTPMRTPIKELCHSSRCV